MKRLTLVLATALVCLNATAQEDSVKVSKASDTIRVGNILIIKKGKTKSAGNDTSVVVVNGPEKKKSSRLKTNWWIIDFGLSNYDDQTNYGNTEGYLADDPMSPDTKLNSRDFILKTGKSVNVNIWFFMQRLNLIKTNVSLKYGLGVELNNYRYKSAISYREEGIMPNGIRSNAPFIFRDSIGFSKNKLAADYLTVPVMLSFSTNRINGRKPLSLSVGVSGGYLYSQRNKQKSEARGKEKNKGDYDLNRFKMSYIAELGLGPVRLYGSYSPNSMYDRGLDMRPYNFGIRLSNL